jgi:hypothetical protein
MPIITPYFVNLPIAVLTGGSSLVADSELSNRLRAVLASHGDVLARLNHLIEANATIAGTSGITAFGRLNSETNVFGSAIITGVGSLTANPSVLGHLVAVLTGVGTLQADSAISPPDSDELRILVQIAQDYDPGFGKTLSARLIADMQTIPIKSFDFNAGKDVAGLDLSVSLSRIEDRDAFDLATEFKFDFYQDTWRTFFDTGKLKGRNVSIGFAAGRANDQASISTAAPVADKLNQTPENNLTIYDPLKLTINADEFQSIPDTDGNLYSQTLIPIPDLTFESLCQKVFVEILGFSRVRSTVLDFPIPRADFSTDESFLDAIGSHVGIYRPLIFSVNNDVWIIDSTTNYSDGLPAPIALTANKYKSATFNYERVEIDGYKIQYSENGSEYDYILPRTDEPEVEENGNLFDDNYTKITTVAEWFDYYKTSNPFVPIRSERKKKTITTTKTFGEEIAVEVESFFYDNLHRPTRTEIVARKLIPALISPFTKTLERVSEKVITYEYRADITNPKRSILYLTTEKESGLLVVDSDNKFLGQDFKQNFVEAYTAGNLKEGQTTEWGAILTKIEKVTQKPNGQQTVSTRWIDHLRGIPRNSTQNERSGDVSQNTQTAQVKELIVLRSNAPRRDRKIVPLPGGLIPLKQLIALARRRLAKTELKRGSVLMKGVDPGIQRGSIVQIFDRADMSQGVFLVEGFRIVGNNLGTAQQSTTQTLDLIEI